MLFLDYDKCLFSRLFNLSASVGSNFGTINSIHNFNALYYLLRFVKASVPFQLAKVRLKCGEKMKYTLFKNLIFP